MTTAPGALSAWGIDQVLYHGEGLWGYVVSQGRGRSQRHHGLGVLLNQQVAADHHAVQVWMPAMAIKRICVGALVHLCARDAIMNKGSSVSTLTFPAGCEPSSQRHRHNAGWGWPRPTAGSCCSPAGQSTPTPAPPAGREIITDRWGSCRRLSDVEWHMFNILNMCLFAVLLQRMASRWSS